MVVGAVVVSVPPHTADVPVGTVSPAGKVSVKATPVRPVLAFGLVTVNVRLVVPFNGIEVGLNPFWIDGGATTVKLAVFEVVPVPPLVELTALVVFV